MNKIKIGEAHPEYSFLTKTKEDVNDNITTETFEVKDIDKLTLRELEDFKKVKSEISNKY